MEFLRFYQGTIDSQFSLSEAIVSNYDFQAFCVFYDKLGEILNGFKPDCYALL